MHRQSAQTKFRPAPQINVTPLIDVLLVLLIIFMVISPLKATRFKARVPAKPQLDQRVAPNDFTLVVSMDTQGRLRLNRGEVLGTANDMSRLTTLLADTFRTRGAGLHGAPLPVGLTSVSTVFIKAPRAIHYGDVARVLDGLKGAGADPIGLQIDELD